MYLKEKLPEYTPETKPKLDPFTLESLIAWLQTKPSDETYEWYNRETPCLFAQYGAAMDLDRLLPGSEIRHSATGYLTVLMGMRKHYGILSCEPFNLASPAPHTFGAALTRARNALEAINGQ